jgi:hypothetical protein
MQGRKVGERWTLCGEEEEAASVGTGRSPLEILQLCNILDRIYPDELEIEDRGTYEALENGFRLKEPDERHELDYGMHYDYGCTRVLSRTLLHEMFHYSGGDYSQYYIP